MSVIAVIPARGGSKGIPLKNLQTVGGVSLVARAVKAAEACQIVDRVYVSTDSDEIAFEAEKYGATTIKRPPEISGDEASSEDAIRHAIGSIENVEVVLFLQCTSPFTSPDDLSKAAELVTTGTFDSVLSVVEDHSFGWELQGEVLCPIGHDMKDRKRRQDLPIKFVETGAFYAFRSREFLQSGSRFHGRVGHVETEKYLNVDIDEPKDLVFANKLAKLNDPGLVDFEISAVVTDFDGVHTDDFVWIDQDGRESVRVSRSDGLAIAILRRSGVPVLVLSTESNPVVRARAKKLEVDLIQGVSDKSQALADWAKALGISMAKIAYIGNDINDLGPMKLVGFPVAVADAHPSVVQASRLVLNSYGGTKAVREFITLTGLDRIGRGEHE